MAASVSLANDHLRPVAIHASATRTLRVEAPACVSRHLIAPALPRFLHQRPGLRVQLREVQGAVEPLPREVDVALRTGSVHDSTLIVQTLATIRRITCASPDFIACNGLPAMLADLEPKHCIGLLEPGTTTVRKWTFSKGRACWSILPAARVAFDDADSAVAAAVRGGGYVRVLSIEVEEKITSGLLRPVLESWNEEQPLSIVHSQNPAQSDDLAAFSAFVAGLFPSTVNSSFGPNARRDDRA